MLGSMHSHIKTYKMHHKKRIYTENNHPNQLGMKECHFKWNIKRCNQSNPNLTKELYAGKQII